MPEPKSAKDAAARETLEREAEDLRRRLLSLDRDLAALASRRRYLGKRLAAIEEQLGVEHKGGIELAPSDTGAFEDLLVKGLEGLGRLSDAAALRVTLEGREPGPDDPKK